MKRIAINLGTAVLIFAGLLLVWQGIIWLFAIQPYILPSPSRVAHAVMANFSALMTSLGITAAAAAGGLAAALVVGILVALLFAQSPWVRRMFDQLDGTGDRDGYADCVHHLSRADYCEYHAGVDQRRSQHGGPVPDA